MILSCTSSQIVSDANCGDIELLQLVGSLKNRLLLQKSPIKETVFAIETYTFKEPTNQSHPISM